MCWAMPLWVHAAMASGLLNSEREDWSKDEARGEENCGGGGSAE
ncbi:hypothetical protein NZD89_25810 [Alicyclobacillus fastidiosus]|uniref:Uncharacterized protein n=1 Tax=Alicyclobacillus fastidiosus TaxID=392011 RepID=A0ABY6ZFI2_9BACL|nr:hypothetical protein [Alicyclobacillus fastidiosus]WAH41612.1 hypothetical protein NZD89_25810 [Alicyclobacillus fastidiosus]